VTRGVGTAAPGEVTQVPRSRKLPTLARAAAGCVRCELHTIGTQTVFGEGPPDAWMVVVGEQPGDKEDLAGRPFVGPAGRVLDRALAELGVDRQELYLTNAVKHFRWEPRGKRRLHRSPSTEHVSACAPWLDAEMRAVAPQALLCLGAVAAKAVLGPKFALTKHRGEVLESRFGIPTFATVHPAAVLRGDDREGAYRSFRDDIAVTLAVRL
jgi:uracil-DNA glycosylase family protein